MPVRRVRAAALLATGVALALGASPPASGVPQPPRFRSGLHAVLVDVYPTKDGDLVRDLTAADFEVAEDGVPQRIEYCELIVPRPGVPVQGRPSGDTAAALPPVPGAAGRRFILFLDTYHVGPDGAAHARGAVSSLLRQLVTPDDLVGVMTPEMSASELAFLRGTDGLEATLDRHWLWSRRGRTVDVEAREAGFSWCYPEQAMAVTCTTGGAAATQPSNFYSGVAREMIERRREKKTFDALADLTRWVGRLPEARTAVLVLSEGWRLFRPDEGLARRSPCDPTAVDEVPRPGVRRPGAAGVSAAGGPAAFAACERDRAVLSSLDNAHDYRTLIALANRVNVSFYTVDPRGLPVFDTTMADTRTSREGVTQPLLTPADAAQRIGSRLEAIRGLAASTDGLAVTGSNDLPTALRRIAADLRAYYLVGFVSTNTRTDGAYRRLAVRVRRPGVEVRARRGYLAPTAADVVQAAAAPGTSARTANETAADGDAVTAMAGDWADLEAAPREAPVRLHLSWLGPGAGRAWRAWAVIDLDPRQVTAGGQFAAGADAEATLADDAGTVIGTAGVEMPPGVRAATVAFDVDQPFQGTLVLRARVTGLGATGAVTDSLRRSLGDRPGVAGQPRLFRRGPGTSRPWLPTARARYSRTEQLRVAVPLGRAPSAFSADVLDRRGRRIPLPVTCELAAAAGTEPATLLCGVALAPLAPGSYGMRVSAVLDGRRETATAAFRVE